MPTPPNLHKISVTWRKKKFVVEMNFGATVKELGQELQKLTDIQEDTMRFIIPPISNKSSTLLSPFSTEHAFLSLEETSITEARSIKMMGVPANEVEDVLQNAKANLRIAGFEDEEKRLKQRISYGPHFPLKLPQGLYIFTEFRTLEIPGIKLNPPPSEALKRMHMLAADPGIVAVMNKHHWRVGVMTEMAPVGYVGVSPKCILGFNKNHGEEISLRLRTDDLKGFRKYESIKKTLLHELAHMVYSEHDANFYSLDKQLNQEAAHLDWTRSASHTLSGVRGSDFYEDENFVGDSSNFSQKLGGNRSDQLGSARASSVAAASRRMAYVSANKSEFSNVIEEPDPDDSSFNTNEEPDLIKSTSKEVIDIDVPICVDKGPNSEPDPDDHLVDVMKLEFSEVLEEPDPDDSSFNTNEEPDHIKSASKEVIDIDMPIFVDKGLSSEPDPDDHLVNVMKHEPDPDDAHHNRNLAAREISEENDPDDSETSLKSNVPAESCNINDFESEKNNSKCGKSMLPDSHCSLETVNIGGPVHASLANEVLEEPDPDDVVDHTPELTAMQTDDPDLDDQELQRINDPVTAVCNRLQKALEMLRVEVSPMQSASVLQTLLKIIRNVIEHPEETRYRRLRKTNPVIERNIINIKAAMEILFLAGFNEDVLFDEPGKSEAYLVLKRNDPGLLWLAKSSLESCIITH